MGNSEALLCSMSWSINTIYWECKKQQKGGTKCRTFSKNTTRRI
jgi:hypothetical protein